MSSRLLHHFPVVLDTSIPNFGLLDVKVVKMQGICPEILLKEVVS